MKINKSQLCVLEALMSVTEKGMTVSELKMVDKNSAVQVTLGLIRFQICESESGKTFFVEEFVDGKFSTSAFAVKLETELTAYKRIHQG